MMVRSKKGFTVIELVIVIVIIGIVTAIGVSWVSSSANRAKKDGAVATATQVKQELSAYFSAKGRYPQTQTQVTTFLTNERNKTELATEFGSTALFGYQGTTGAGGACSATGQPACEKYTITVKKSGWGGTAADSDITIAP